VKAFATAAAALDDVAPEGAERRTRIPQSVYLREALDDLLKKYALCSP
jgi:hypothetical protein